MTTVAVKCARCNRPLKNIQYIGGDAYGPICFVKIGGVVVSKTRRRKADGPVEDPGQEKFFEFDTKAIELRVAESVLPAKDFHTLKAAEYFKIAYEDVTHAQREFAKGLNFAKNYGFGELA